MSVALAQDSGSELVFWVLGLLLLILLVLTIVLFKFLNLWIQAYLSKTPITFFRLIAMRLRRVDPTVIVRAMISGTQADLQLDVQELEAHYLAGGDVPAVVRAVVVARRADLPFDFVRATAIDLAGRDVLEEVRALQVERERGPRGPDAPDQATG